MVAPELKARYVDVYLPSEKAKQLWEEEARKSGLPLSKFVFEAVEAFRALKEETPRSELVRELAETKEEAQKLRTELKLKNMLLEKLESEVYKSRYSSFAEVDSVEGPRHHDQEIIRILKSNRTIEGFEILKELGIDPRDTGAVRLVNNQLDSLRRFGLAEESSAGWKWVR